MLIQTVLFQLLTFLMRNHFPKRPSGAPLHTLSKLYDAPVGCVTPSFEAVYCFICGRQRVVVARYLIISLILLNSHLFPLPCGAGITVPREWFTLIARLSDVELPSLFVAV